MRNLIFCLGVSLGCASCSGSDDDEPCDLAHRDGTYVQSFQERAGGSCGPLSDSVVVIDAEAMRAATGVPLDCALDADDEVSSDQCSLTRAYTCMFPDTTISFVGITKEQGGGDRLVGTMTATAFAADGTLSCRSTYDVTFTRQ